MKFAIIGTNFVSDNFMHAAQQVSDFQLVAVCSRNIDNAKAFAQKYHTLNYYDDYKVMFEKTPFDAVYIATPNALHYQQALFFLENKIAVLCEKPLASNIDEVKHLIKVSHANNTLFMEAIMPPTTPNYHVVKESLGKLGTIRRAFYNFGKYSSRYDQYREGVVLNTFKNELSNGSLMDMGIYSVYNVISLFGVPSHIYANTYMLKSGVDGLGSIIFSYPESEAILLHSKITDTTILSEIQGEDGNLIITGVSVPTKIIFKPRGGEAIDLTVDQHPNPMVYEITDFIQCIKEDKIESPLVPHQLMLDVHETMTKIRQQISLTFPADKK